MTRTVISTEDASILGAPLSRGIRKGPILQVSGQLPFDPDTGEVAGATVADQTAQTLRNVDAVLKAAGAGWEDVVMLRVYLTEPAHLAEMNQAYATAVGASGSFRRWGRALRAHRGPRLSHVDLRHIGAAVTLVVHEHERLGRGLDLAALAEQLKAADVGLEFLTGDLQGSHDPSGIVFTVLSALSGMEREYIRDRTLEGHEPARRHGKRIGGAPVVDEAMLSMALHLRADPQPARHRRTPGHLHGQAERTAPLGSDRPAHAPRP
ncbi:Rid family hydrolase [Nonomuraea wenchangensis]|uniref:Rid family hydrolase n=1 Tax=Nonomuraea wenchangensis TaxID=568860 RepID=UPI0034250D27